MTVKDIKPIVRGIAQLQSVRSGGVITYNITSVTGDVYQFEVDSSDKSDVGESAVFNLIEKGIILMRWIRKANENDTLIKIK
jgi:hypothetical protein